jgi:uncharacterized SAM-binding protein YcdF (DUF218 family)
MIFALTKIGSWLVVPSNLLVVGSALGVLAGSVSARLRWLGGLWLALLLAAALLPLGSLLLLPLEGRFSRPVSLPPDVHGIIVLGGAARSGLAAARNEASTNEHGERLAAGLLLARRYPDAILLYTGGSASLVPEPFVEADVAQRWYAEAGLRPSQLRLEARSRTTWENAWHSKRLLAPTPDQTWILVTSAFHMPRAVAAFEAVGWPVVPWPVDYQTRGRVELLRWPLASDNLASLDLSAHEWLGLLFYRLSGRTREIMPRPEGG